MKRCDICGAEARKLNTLAEEYQTADLKGACDGCIEPLNKMINNLNRAANKVLNQVHRSWRHRLFDKFVKQHPERLKDKA